MEISIDLLQKAKIPCPETGITVHHSICDICTPAMHCGLNAYVKDGVIVKVDGWDGFPRSNGKLCTKGAANREYVYRADRIQTPLKRIREHGEDTFVPISWEQAYKEIGEKLNAIRDCDGPEAVAWFSGYSKWFRPWLHRMAHSFGSLNYGTESSSCQMSLGMAWKATAGIVCRGDIAHANTAILWGSNPPFTSYAAVNALDKLKERGGQVIVIDPRITPTTMRFADKHLRIQYGTDGALALALGHCILRDKLYNKDFVDQYVFGFAEYCELVKSYTPQRTAVITGLSVEEIEDLAERFALHGPSTITLPSAALSHNTNGFNNMRAIIALQVIMGWVDVSGGALPAFESWVYNDGGFETNEKVFINEFRPKDCKPKIGAQRYPVWSALIDEFQAIL